MQPEQQPTEPQVTIQPPTPLEAPTPVEPQPQQATPAQTTPPVAQDPGKTLGIVGLILAFLAPAIGLIVSIIGYSKSKTAGFKNGLALAGIIISSVFLVFWFLGVFIIFLSVPALQKNARDTSRKNDASIIQGKINEYYADNASYPNNLSQLTGSYAPTTATVKTSDLSYTPTPTGCTDNCSSYTLSVQLENGTTYTQKP